MTLCQWGIIFSANIILKNTETVFYFTKNQNVKFEKKKRVLKLSYCSALNKVY